MRHLRRTVERFPRASPDAWAARALEHRKPQSKLAVGFLDRRDQPVVAGQVVLGDQLAREQPLDAARLEVAHPQF